MIWFHLGVHVVSTSLRYLAFLAFLQCTFEVQQFGSIPQLLQLTASVDLLKISEGMQEYSAELRRDAASFWSSVLHRVDAQLSGTFNVEHSDPPGRELVKSR